MTESQPDTTLDAGVNSKPIVKEADQPHRWTLGLAVAALVVSLVSAAATYRNGTIANRALALSRSNSRASLYVQSATFIGPAKKGHPMKFRLSVKNVGEATARDVRLVIFQPTSNLVYSSRSSADAFAATMNLVEGIRLEAIPKHEVEDLTFQTEADWSLGPPNLVAFTGRLKYRSGDLEDDVAERICLAPTVDLLPKKLPLPTNVMLRDCTFVAHGGWLK